MNEAQGAAQGNWFDSLLPSAPVGADGVADRVQATEGSAGVGNDTTPLKHAPPANVSAAVEWKTLLANVRGVRPQLLRVFQAIHRLGAVLVRGEYRFFLARGNMPEDVFEQVISTLYFHVISKKVAGPDGEPDPGSVEDILWGLRRQGARLKESGETGLTLSRGSISADDWEVVKQSALQPNRDEILRLQREAREEVNFALKLSSLAKVTGDKDVEWRDL